MRGGAPTKLLIVDAHELTAECYRFENSPDREKGELEGALGVAETIADASMKPHSVRAKLLEALGDNPKSRRRPQTDKAAEYYDRCAAEFAHAGLLEEAEQVSKEARNVHE